MAFYNLQRMRQRNRDKINISQVKATLLDGTFIQKKSILNNRATYLLEYILFIISKRMPVPDVNGEVGKCIKKSKFFLHVVQHKYVQKLLELNAL